MSLREIDPSKLAQRDPELRMRWFSSEDEDLFVWQRAADEVLVALQYCRGRETLAWSEDHGLRTGLVDDGEVDRPSLQKMAPVVSYHDAPDEQLSSRLSRSLLNELETAAPRLAARVRESLG